MPIVNGGGGSVDANNVYPWFVPITPYMGGIAVQGTWGLFASTDANAIFNGFFDNSGTLAQNDEITWPVVLGAGTWALRVLCTKFSDRAIATVSLGGTQIGTFDEYNAAVGLYNQIATISGVVVATSGKLTLSFKAATKNASSSGFRLSFQLITLTRTA